jgi:hypothetical protein
MLLRELYETARGKVIAEKLEATGSKVSEVNDSQASNSRVKRSQSTTHVRSILSPRNGNES